MEFEVWQTVHCLQISHHLKLIYSLISDRGSDDHSKEFTVARMTVVITMAFIFLNIPYVIYSISAADSSSSLLYSYSFFMIVTTDRLFTGCNMLVNLITYSLMSRNFRNTLKDMLSCNKSMKRSDTTQRISNTTEDSNATTESRTTEQRTFEHLPM